MTAPATRTRQRPPDRWTAFTLGEQIAIVHTHLSQAEQGGNAESIAFWRSRLRYLEGAQVDDGQA